MENNTNQTVQQTTNGQVPDGQERTFTQEEVNRIVQDRLLRERNKFQPETDVKLQELAEREKALEAREREAEYRAILRKKDIPDEVYEALNCTSDEAFNKALEILNPYFQRAKEPFMNPVGPTTGRNDVVGSIRAAMGIK